MQKIKERGCKKVRPILWPHIKSGYTITHDKGKAFTEHEKTVKKQACSVYFAHLYASWERGRSEYTNKLIRQYFPKSESLENIPYQRIIQVMELLNNRPRKKLAYKTPKEVFYEYISKNKCFALDG